VIAIVLAALGLIGCLVVMVVDYMRWRKKKAAEVDEQWAPRPIDANNPPRYMKYAPKPGRQPLRCTVCFHLLNPGDRVLLWPKQAGAYDLLCPECWKVQPQ
jgi:hypothetical protein